MVSGTVRVEPHGDEEVRAIFEDVVLDGPGDPLPLDWEAVASRFRGRGADPRAYRPLRRSPAA